jgi:copper chaperone CopZ
MHTVTLKIEGMKCDGCATAVRSALEGVEGVSAVDVSLPDGSASVQLEPSVDRSVLVDVIAEAGYQAV